MTRTFIMTNLYPILFSCFGGDNLLDGEDSRDPGFVHTHRVLLAVYGRYAKRTRHCPKFFSRTASVNHGMTDTGCHLHVAQTSTKLPDARAQPEA